MTFFKEFLNLFIDKLQHKCYSDKACGCGGMADAADSKSAGGDIVRVQVPPSAL